MRYKLIGRYSPAERLWRVCSLSWERGTVGDGTGYSRRLTLGLMCRFPFVRLRLHTSYGGLYP